MERRRFHPLSDVQAEHIGEGTTVWQFVVILKGAHIGKECNICSHCFIENNVWIGDRVTIKNGVYVWDGIFLDDDVFIGSNVSFTNDRYPKSKVKPSAFIQTKVCRGASIGAGSVLLPGITIGEGSIIGAGSVVCTSVPAFSVVTGNPGKARRVIDRSRD